jgi:hypothetical protein
LGPDEFHRDSEFCSSLINFFVNKCVAQRLKEFVRFVEDMRRQTTNTINFSTELQVDRADSQGFVMLAIDTTPGYTDTQPFPSAPCP